MTDRDAILAIFGVTENELDAFEAAFDSGSAEAVAFGDRMSDRLAELADELSALLPGDLVVNCTTWPGRSPFKAPS